MSMRCEAMVALLLAGLAASAAAFAAPLAAQPGAAGRTSVGAFLGLGDGPSPSGVIGLRAIQSVTPSVSAGLEASRWQTGVVAACTDIWPRSYRCDVGGWTALLVARLDARRTAPARLALEAQGGVFRHSDTQFSGESAAAWGLGASVAPRLGERWRIVLGGRYLRIYDDGYSSLLGEGLHFAVGTLGLELTR